MKLVRTQVHMLPTEDYPAIAQSNTHIKAFGAKVEKLYGWVKCAIRTPHSLCHLYFTSEEEIQQGDWYIAYGFNKLVYQCEEILLLKDKQRDGHIYKKIIATTDKSIYQYAIHSEGRIKVDLPQPSQEFIEDYCEQGGIKCVDIEYTKGKDISNGFLNAKSIMMLKINQSNNTITTHSIKESWNKDELPQLVVDILNKLNEDQESIPDDEDLLEYVKQYIK